MSNTIKSLSFKTEIEDLIKEKRRLYSEYPKYIFKDYTDENQLKRDYAGRQILELLQNADDAGSPEVLLRLDKENKRLIIANKGNEPFSAGGIQSLMLPNYSTKNKRSYIGNKGLGFRSVLNWANKIEIISQGCMVTFSSEIAASEFNLFKNADSRVKEILKERGLKDGATPLPILGIPDISANADAENESWITYIRLYYEAGDEESIIDQLDKFSPQVLLFLRNIDSVEIEGVLKSRMIVRSKTQSGDISIGGTDWKLFENPSKEELLPEPLQDPNREEKEYYKIKIAYQKDLSDKYYKLFNFFPTDLSINLPCIIHGTFDLDSSRKQINSPSKKNDFILDRLLELLKKLALELTNGSVTWDAYCILTPLDSVPDSPQIKWLYSELAKLKTELVIYPCVDGKYRKLSDIRFYTAEFSKWISEKKYAMFLPELLMEPEERVVTKTWPIKIRYSTRIFKDKINDLSHHLDNISDRADLIEFLIGENDFTFSRYDLIINKENKVVTSDVIAFTPVKQGEELDVPDFIQIDFIHKDLYKVLVERNKHHFDQDTTEERGFHGYFKSILNVQPYDSNNVIDKIMNASRTKVNELIQQDFIDEAKNKILFTLKSLFKTYTSLKSPEAFFGNTLLIIAGDGSIRDSEELFINEYFESGKITSEIYGENLKLSQRLASIEIFGLPIDDLPLLERFFVWIGVTRFVRLKKQDIYGDTSFNEYIDCNLKYLTECPEDFSIPRITQKTFVKTLKDWNTIKDLDLKSILLLIMQDARLRVEILNDVNSIGWYYVKQRAPLIVPHSYIMFQLLEAGKFGNLVLEDLGEDLGLLINAPWQKLKTEIEKYCFDPVELNRILLRLGAKNSFIDIDVDKVYQYLQECGNKKWERKVATKLYENVFDYCRARKEIKFERIGKSHLLLASKNGDFDYKPNGTVYYSDNQTLPTKLLDEFWVFDFPGRNGEKQIANFFGTNPFNNIKIDAVTETIKVHSANEKLNSWLKKIKPYILAYRIKPIKDPKEKERSAKLLKGFSLNLTSSLKYQVLGGAAESLEKNELIIDSKNNYYICADAASTLKDLCATSDFCNSIAEMYCILFEVNFGWNSFRSIFKDSEGDTINVINSKSLQSHLDESKALLGLPQFEFDFWDFVFTKMGKKLRENISDYDELKQTILEELTYELPDYYLKIDLNKVDNVESLDFLKSFNSLSGISLQLINERLPHFPALKNYHQKIFDDVAKGVEVKLVYALWWKLQASTHQEQLEFAELKESYPTKALEIATAISKENEYVFQVDYESLLIEMLEKQYNIVFSDLSSVSTIVNLYPQYKLIDHDYTNEELSRFYFDGNEVFLKNLFDEITDNKVDQTESANENNSQVFDLNFTSLKDISVPTTSPSKPRKPYIYSEAKKRSQKKSGKNAELAVRNALVKEYGRENVKWISKNSDEENVVKDDGKGYDIEYKHQNSNNWFLLEVKAVSGDSFIISSNEVEVAIENREKYHLALVSGNEINLVENFFLDSGRVSHFNSLMKSGSIRSLDFEVYFSLPRNQEQTFIRERVLNSEMINS